MSEQPDPQLRFTHATKDDVAGLIRAALTVGTTPDDLVEALFERYWIGRIEMPPPAPPMIGNEEYRHMSSDLNERPAGFVERICPVDSNPCEGQGTLAECGECLSDLHALRAQVAELTAERDRLLEAARRGAAWAAAADYYRKGLAAALGLPVPGHFGNSRVNAERCYEAGQRAEPEQSADVMCGNI